MSDVNNQKTLPTQLLSGSQDLWHRGMFTQQGQIPAAEVHYWAHRHHSRQLQDASHDCSHWHGQSGCPPSRISPVRAPPVVPLQNMEVLHHTLLFRGLNVRAIQYNPQMHAQRESIGGTTVVHGDPLVHCRRSTSNHPPDVVSISCILLARPLIYRGSHPRSRSKRCGEAYSTPCRG